MELNKSDPLEKKKKEKKKKKKKMNTQNSNVLAVLVDQLAVCWLS